MSFKVTLLPSGREFSVESGETVLDAAIREGIGLPYGCRSGRCGTCTAILAQGEVEYPDGPPEALEHEPEDRCLPCVAHPHSDLVLEAREVESLEQIEVRVLPARVQGIDHLAHDVVRLWLKLPDTQRLQFRAGQYIDFVLDEASPRPMLFIGGGTGLAPLKSQIEHAFHKGIERPMTLYWGVRSQRDLYLPDLPEQWAREHANFRYVPVLSEPDADWTGRTGFVHEAVLADIDDLAAHDFYMAGPPVMVKAALDALHSASVPDAQIHYDSFEYAAAKGK
ncbi:CDP-4-dehydro-6-deoxyglucose reductase [endosymbiont of unidentified scaly snail isolate Monju]|nr:2Fe-2S iron-sulfur cluster-binding protein [endosymbiont of unidentified scaly snail isolate Monju]BAN68055.1 CDP-4-dehydro-6-deoxyglucose reductase [endosymbiont of unidentified scaly snail isolate Monju]